MTLHELTADERNQMMEKALKNMGIKRQHLSRKALEKEIVDYLSKKQPCSLATCGRDGAPRISVVDYVNDGLVIYILSEGGEKFKNIRENNRVAVGIGTGARALKTRGINIQGIAHVFADGDPEFESALGLFRQILKEMSAAVGTGPETLMPRNIMRFIRITPIAIVYHHTQKGIKHARWETGG